MRVSFGESNGRKASLGSLLLVVAAAAGLGGAVPAAAAPTLFSGVVQQSGGIVLTTMPFTTLPGPTSGAPATASNTPSGNFTLPAAAFSTSTPGYTFSFPPVYPYAFVQFAGVNGAGSFAKSYLTPSVPVTFSATNSLSKVPVVTGTPRQGFMRLNPGSNGFGGRMPVSTTRVYNFLIATSLGTLAANATLPRVQGDESLGGWVQFGTTPNGKFGTTYPTASPSIVLSAAGGGFRGPWITGKITQYQPLGAAITNTTSTGVDARTAFNQGVISLVTPELDYVYQGDGAGTMVSVRDGYAVNRHLVVTFLPEPGQVSLLAAGLIGLAGLAWVRRALPNSHR